MKTFDCVIQLLYMVSQAAENRGFDFVTADEDALASKRTSLIWLKKPQFISHEGTIQGRQTYHINMVAIRRGSKCTYEEKMTYRAFLEDTLIDICTSLSLNEHVAVIENLRSEEPKGIADGYVAAEISADVEMIF